VRSLRYTIRRLDAFFEALDVLLQSEFPYADSKVALERVRVRFEDLKSELKGFTPDNDPEVVKRVCRVMMERITEYLPLLGFILRSTNVRNAFEIHGPLLRLAQQLLGEETHLVLSSEWDYPHYTYVEALPEFVLIGFPAPEAANPLLLPLSGHELAHNLVALRDLRREFESELEKALVHRITSRLDEYRRLFPDTPTDASELSTNLIAIDTWRPAFDHAFPQAEETFCDIIGLGIFGTAYLHAFEYVVSPNLSSYREPNYPQMRVRAQTLKEVANDLRVEVPDGFVEMFLDAVPRPTTVQDSFLVEMADLATRDVTPKLLKRANTILTDAKISRPTREEVELVADRLAMAVPATRVSSLAALANGAWEAFLSDSPWSNTPNISPADGDRVLTDLVLKSIEVFEIERRQQVGSG
jgi:hypothetical protein